MEMWISGRYREEILQIGLEKFILRVNNLFIGQPIMMNLR